MKWWLFPTFGVLACAGYFLSPAGAVSETIFVAIGTVSVLAVVVGIFLRSPTSPTAWAFVAAGCALWVLGDAAFYFVDGDTSQSPSVADAVYLTGYPVLAIGLYRLVHQGWRRGQLGHVANSSIVMVAFGLLMWVFVVQPEAVDVSTAEGLLGVAYPAMDVFLLGLLVHFIGATQWRSITFRLLTAAVVAILAADTATNVSSVVARTTAPTVADAGFLAFYVLVGTAALHPSMHDLTAPRPHHDSSVVAASFNFPTVLVVTAATLTAPGVMAILLARGEPVTEWGWGVVVCATVLVCLVFVRVTELLRLLQLQTRTLRESADTDHLTGLLGRRGLERWADTGHSQEPLVFLLLGIDRFREINDTFGRALGDDILRSVAGRLRAALGERAVLGRLGADEFAVIGPGEVPDGAGLADELRAALARPIGVRGATLLVEISIGVAYGRGLSIDALGQRASLALEVAKTTESRVATYDASMDHDGRGQLSLLSELTVALTEKQLEVYYQPQVDLTVMRAVGVEALLRWNHPTRGLIEPDSFLPMAERTGLVRPLLDFVLTEALTQRRRWSEAGLDLTVSINASTRNLVGGSFVEQVRRSLERSGTTAESLVLEVTETTAMTDPSTAIESLATLRGLGVTLAIDDFGTGYSSLAYLQRLPVQQLKIDRAFVTDMTTVPAHAVIVRSTIELAWALGLAITAEGVEDHSTLVELRKLSCHYAQGYYLGRPTPAHEVPSSIRELDARLGETTEVT